MAGVVRKAQKCFCAARSELKELVRSREEQTWNPWTVTYCIAVPTALFAHVAHSLCFRLRHRHTKTAWFLGPVVGFIIALAVSSSAYSRLQKDRPARALITLAGGCLLAVLFGALLGEAGYNAYGFPYYSYFDLATYVNIDPSADKGQSYMDAGQVYFKEGTRVLAEQGVAFQSAGTYCAAPIVRESIMPQSTPSQCAPGCMSPQCEAGPTSNGGSPLVNGGTCIERCAPVAGNASAACGEGAAYEQAGSYDCSGCDTSAEQGQATMKAPSKSGTVDFWVVGEGCCEASGAAFHCGAVGSKLARSGLRFLRDDTRPFYMMAVQEWTARNGVMARHPLFFHWVEDPIAEVDGYMRALESMLWLNGASFVIVMVWYVFGVLWALKLAGFPDE